MKKKNQMVIKAEYIKQLSENWLKCGVNRVGSLFLHSNITRTIINAKRKGIQLTPDDIHIAS